MEGATRGNLPTTASPIVGRDELVASALDLLDGGRLVTLIGVGGVGKTRLALEIAARAAEAFPDGVWFIDLAAVDEPDAVVSAVAATLGVTPSGDGPLVDALAESLRGRGALLVVDSCEHVRSAVAALVATILSRARRTKVVATSREALQVAGERRLSVTPLPVDGGTASFAVALFVERARAVRPNFELDGDSATAVAVVEICRVLDGLPLGIELAAARMAGMGAADLRERLDDRFRLLEGDPEAPRRQRTLQDTVAWSFDLLDPAERDVLLRASVFAGGFDLATYAAVYDATDDVVLLRSLDRLVRASLVVAEHAEGRARYRLLETIRQFGVEQLAGDGALDATRDWHARHFAREIASRWERWNGAGWREAVDWVILELANLRAAFRWSAERDVVVATDLAAHAALIGTSAQVFEPIDWAERLLETATAADVPRLPRLYAAVGYACFLGRAATAAGHAHRATELEQQPGYDPCQPGLATYIEALATVYAGDLDGYLALAKAAAAAPGTARAFALPAYVDGLQASGRVDEALALVDGAVAAAREVGNPFWIAYALWTAGLALSNTDPGRALSAWDEGVDVVREHRVEFFAGFLARDAARLHATHGDPDTALALFASAINAFNQAGNLAQLVITLASVPAALERLGAPVAAATLHAAALQQPASIHHVPELAELGERLAAQLGDGMAEPGAAGAAMDLDDAVAYARAQLDLARSDLARSSGRDRPGGLSRREVEVLRLVADGLSTREIAERLFISAKTADRHIQNLYTKIGTSTRATATRWAIDHGLVDASSDRHPHR